jgi:energy-converting hydrogenase Eha subunit C
MSLLFPVVMGAAASGLHDGELDAITRWVLLSGAILILLAPLYLLLLGLAHAHLLAVPVILLLWGYSRATGIWLVGFSARVHPSRVEI